MLYYKIKKYLSDNNINIDKVIDKISLRDDSNGKGSFIESWNIDNIKKPTDNYLNSISYDHIELIKIKENKISQCKDYLNKTDWEHIAFLERGRPYDEVKNKRILAVEVQDLINDCSTLEELNNINTDF